MKVVIKFYYLTLIICGLSKKSSPSPFLGLGEPFILEMIGMFLTLRAQIDAELFADVFASVDNYHTSIAVIYGQTENVVRLSV